jgi:hypothetical protein
MTARSKADLRRLTLPQLLEVLQRAGSKKVTQEYLKQLIDSGCPTNTDGTINFIDFVRYLAQK